MAIFQGREQALMKLLEVADGFARSVTAQQGRRSHADGAGLTVKSGGFHLFLCNAQLHQDPVPAEGVVFFKLMGGVDFLPEAYGVGSVLPDGFKVEGVQIIHREISSQTRRWSETSIHWWPASPRAGQNTPQALTGKPLDGNR